MFKHHTGNPKYHALSKQNEEKKKIEDKMYYYTENLFMAVPLLLSIFHLESNTVVFAAQVLYLFKTLDLCMIIVLISIIY